MKKFLIVLIAILSVTNVDLCAQDKKFSPEKFNAALEKYIVQEANLNQEEASKILPLLKEMHDRQRVVYSKMRKLNKEKLTTEKECAEAIKQYDKMNIELKHIEHGYHKKMMLEVSALKVYDVIKAENRFHRRMIKGWQKGKRH